MKQLFLSFIAILICIFTVQAQEQEEKWHPAGTLTWEQYGLSFTLLDKFRIADDKDMRQQIRTCDMDIDINIMDRRRYTDEQIGQEVIASATRGGMNVNEAIKMELDNGAIKGGYVQGVLDDGSPAVIMGFVIQDTMYGCIIIAQCAPDALKKLESVCSSMSINVPEQLKIKK